MRFIASFRQSSAWSVSVVGALMIYMLFWIFPPHTSQSTKKEGQVQSQTQPQPQPAAQSWQRQSPAPAPTQQGQQWEMRPVQPEKSYAQTEFERQERARIEQERFRQTLRSLDTLKPRESQEQKK